MRGIFEVLQVRISVFLTENLKVSRFHENDVICLDEYRTIYTLKMPFYCKNHENVLASMEQNHFILEIFEGLGNLGGAEFLPLWHFWLFLQNI